MPSHQVSYDCLTIYLMAAKTKHRITRQRGRKQSRRISKRKKQCGGGENDFKKIIDERDELKAKVDANIAELEAQKARIAELEAQIAELEARNAKLERSAQGSVSVVPAPAPVVAPAPTPAPAPAAVVAAPAPKGSIPPQLPNGMLDPGSDAFLRRIRIQPMDFHFGFPYYAFHNDEARVQQMLANGRAPNVRDFEGQSPVLLAAYFGYLSMVKLLVSGGADLTIADNKGNTPLSTVNKRLDLLQSIILKNADDLRQIGNLQKTAVWIRAQGVTK